MTAVDAWGGSWGTHWLLTWTYTPAVPGPPSGGAGGGGRRRRFPFPNREDDPFLFIPRKEPEPEPVAAEQPYVEGDPVSLPSGPTTLSELGSLAPFPRRSAPRQSKKRAPEPPASIAEPATEPVEQVRPNEEEEMYILRMFGFL